MDDAIQDDATQDDAPLIERARRVLLPAPVEINCMNQARASYFHTLLTDVLKHMHDRDNAEATAVREACVNLRYRLLRLEQQERQRTEEKSRRNSRRQR